MQNRVGDATVHPSPTNGRFLAQSHDRSDQNCDPPRMVRGKRLQQLSSSNTTSTAMNFTVQVPEGTTNHGDPHLMLYPTIMARLHGVLRSKLG